MNEFFKTLYWEDFLALECLGMLNTTIPIVATAMKMIKMPRDHEPNEGIRPAMYTVHFSEVYSKSDDEGVQGQRSF
jgi:hypothetical protein